MSMLAERKVKQRWSLNPRGNTWSEDSNKFGQKLLEKMGWSKGKGLGPKENGMLEHVKVSYKYDSKGMGYKESNDQWTEHEDKFSAFLQTLTGDKPPEKPPQIASLELKSQNSKVRVHYKKFTRGKDLSRCSDKDLACIFGKRSPKPGVTPSFGEMVEVKDSFTQNGGSMVDYFKRKLPNFGKNNSYVVGSNGVLKCQSETQSEEERPGFGMPDRELNTIAEEDENGSLRVSFNDSRAEGKKKKKGKNEGIENPNFDTTDDGVGCQNGNFEVKRKKKKKKDEEDATGIENPSFDIAGNCQNEEVSNETFETSQNGRHADFEVKRKKEKKKKQQPGPDSDLGLENPNFDGQDGEEAGRQNNNFEVKRKKKRKSAEASNFDASENGQDGEDMGCHNNKFEVKRKKRKSEEMSNFDSQNGCHSDFEVKRKKKRDDLGVENPNFDTLDDNSGCPNNKFEVKRGKKQKSEEKSFGIDNRGSYQEDLEVNRTSDDVSSRSFDSSGKTQNGCDFEVKRKKKRKSEELSNRDFDTSENGCHDDFEVKRKKKKRDLGVENPTFDTTDDCQNNYVDSSFEVKRKKKKDDALAIDNPNFEDSVEENAKIEQVPEPSFDLILNITSTPSVPKPPKKPLKTPKRRKSVRFSDVNEEHIIPSNDDVEKSELFDINSRVIEDGLEEISKKIDGFQAEVENDINQAKLSRFVGVVGKPGGGNEKLPNGTTRLEFRHGQFGRTPSYHFKNRSRAQTSYKHLIKGDIVLTFNNTNLHEIDGYGVKK